MVNSLLLGLVSLSLINNTVSYREVFNYVDNERNNHSVSSINESHLSSTSLRIYSYDDLIVDEILSNAFINSECTDLMLSNQIVYVNDDVFNNSKIKNLYYTGGKEEFDSLGLSYEFNKITYYAFDEGFINYWNIYIRPNQEDNICLIDKNIFATVYAMYVKLSEDDLAVVNDYKDVANATIKDSMKTLINHFSNTNNTNTTEEISQTSALVFIIATSIIGMTSICIFFLLKERNMIE